MKSNFYELTYIVNAVLDEEQIKATVQKYTDFMTSGGAEFDEIDEWGIQRFAYEMDGKNSGYYVNAFFTGPVDLIAKLERQMLIDDNILRFLTLKYDNKMLHHRDLQKKGKLPVVFEPREKEATEES
jgi:small subunit ribosomal protein S6